MSTIQFTPEDCNFDNFTLRAVAKKFTNKNKQTFTYHILQYLYEGTLDWYVNFPKMFSFGLSKSDFEGGSTKYSLSLVLKDKDGATPEQQKSLEFVEKLVNMAKNWIIQNGELIEEYEVEPVLLKDMSPIYIKKEKGKPIADYPPTLTCNVVAYNDNIKTEFYKEGTDDRIPPSELFSTKDAPKYYNVTSSGCNFEVYVPKGLAKTKVRCIMHEAEIEQRKEREGRLTGGGGRRRNLYNPEAEPTPSAKSSAVPAEIPVATSSSNNEDDLVDEAPPAPKQTKPVVKEESEPDESGDDKEDSPPKKPVVKKTNLRRAK